MIATEAQFTEVDTPGARGSGDQELNYVTGWAGSDVRGIAVRDHGHTTEATVQGGRFDGSTVRRFDGSTNTVRAAGLLGRRPSP